MDAKTTIAKAKKYCNGHRSCSNDCPLYGNTVCIDNRGRLTLAATILDFEKFAEDFTFMIKEIYKDGLE